MRSKPKAHSIFVPALDGEHAKVLAYLGELNKAIAAGGEGERVHAVLREMLDYVAKHFSHEEKMMRSAAYSGYSWHKQQHDAARRRAQSFVERVDGGEPAAASELMEFLASWLRDHTAVHDRMMGAYLRNFERAHSAPAS